VVVYGKQEIARRLADELQLTPGAAADEVDRVVAGILRKLRKGRDARLRGVGILHPIPKKRKGPVGGPPNAKGKR
jgi:nucleoid DNA-binding protein